jgi:mercuric ion transport protein
MTTKIATLGSILTAFLASLCCIGPIALALLGLGGVGLFTALGEYRPYIMTLTVMLLGIGFYLTYRKHKVRCADGTCKTENIGRWNKLAVWLAAFVITFFLIFPYLDINTGGSTENAGTSLEIVVLSIKGMTCLSCNTAVQIALKKNPGVREAIASYETEEATVRYDPSKVSTDELVHIVNNLGYKAQLKDHITPKREVNQ